MQMATPKTSQLDRELRAAREAMGSRHLLHEPVKRKTHAPTTADLRRRWNEMKRRDAAAYTTVRVRFEEVSA